MAALATTQTLDHVGMLLRMNEKPPAERLPFTPENMKLRREQMRISQTKLGQMLEPAAGQRTVVSWESGDFNVKSPRREQIAEILGLQDVPTQEKAKLAAVSSEPRLEAKIAIKQMRALMEVVERALD